MEDAYKEMSWSILSGSITTFGSGFFLYFCSLLIFKKFAFLITSTIVMSYLTSMLLFGAMCHIIGPQPKLNNLKDNNLK